MAYLLSGSEIRRPQEIDERNNTQMAQHRTLDGTINRDYFGDNKRVWILRYENTKKADYDTIKAIYDTYLSTVDTVTWQVTETNYTVASTNVHIEVLERGFSVRGTTYLSDFDLILTEA